VITALSVPATLTALGFAATDLEGTYFATGDYSITAISDPEGIATVQVANGSKADAPTDGPYILRVDGSWGP
jgi:hypothetical protein